MVQLTKMMKILIVVALFVLATLPAYAGTWVYSGGNKMYCSPTGCIGVDKVYSTYQTYKSPTIKYDYHRDIRGNVDIDIHCDSGCKKNCNNDCKNGCDSLYRRPYTTIGYNRYYDNAITYRGVEYTYPYNHRVVRMGYPYYTTQRYSYW